MHSNTRGHKQLSHIILQVDELQQGYVHTVYHKVYQYLQVKSTCKHKIERPDMLTFIATVSTLATIKLILSVNFLIKKKKKKNM